MTTDTARLIAYHDTVCSPNCGDDISTYPTIGAPMTTSEYVPSAEDMENRYVLWSLTLMDFPPGDREAWAEKLRAEFRRGLTHVRCDAYDEGYEDGQHDAHEHRPWRKSVHPYRQEQANE